MTSRLTKTCKKCGVSKSISEFYVHPETADGYLNHCKQCVKARVAEHRRTPKGREVEARKYVKDQSDGKLRARARILNGVRRGIIARQSCEICGKPNAQAHHDDYARPLDVRWLCAEHHGALHRQLRQATR